MKMNAKKTLRHIEDDRITMVNIGDINKRQLTILYARLVMDNKWEKFIREDIRDTDPNLILRDYVDIKDLTNRFEKILSEGLEQYDKT